MNFDLTAEQRMAREMARRFAEKEIIPVARKHDLSEEFPRQILCRMASLGLLGGPIPKEYGGSGLDFISHALVTEEIGRADSSVRTTMSVQVSLVELTLLAWGTEEQKRAYLPRLCRGEIIGCFALTEPDAGSDAAAQSTVALRKEGGWVLTGVKTFISNGNVADLIILIARTDKTKGHKGLTAFLVERGSAGIESRAIKGKLGLRSSDTAELVFRECWIPEHATLGREGEGFYVAMSALDQGRLSVAAGCVGIIQGCIDACVRYARERRQFGKPIGGFQLVQDMIARMVVDCEAARLLVFRAAHLKNKGVHNTLETSIAKYFSSEAAVRSATDAIQIFGAYGYTDENPVERYYRDAKAATIYEGTSQIQKLIIGHQILGIKAFT